MLNVLGLANVYHCRPSSLLDLVDPYTAYCFDEACAYIIMQIEQGNKPQFKKRYKSFKDIYAQYK